MRTNDAIDGSRRLNGPVLAALQRGEIVFTDRRRGKTITMLTFIAATTVEHEPLPIVVCGSIEAAYTLRSMWMANFDGLPQPRWMSYRKFLSSKGLVGNVFLDEPRASWNQARILEHARHCAFHAGGLVCGVVSLQPI